MSNRRLPYWLLLMGAYAVALVVAMVVAGCATPPLQAIVESAVADGEVTPAEVDQINAALPKSFEWGALAEVGLTVAGSLLGVKLLPNSVLRGPWDRPQPPSQPA